MDDIVSRLAHIEHSLTTDKESSDARITDLQTTLDQIQQRISELTVQDAARPKAETSPARRIRPAQPKLFNGSRDHGRDFLTSCEVYFGLLRQDFEDEGVRIGFVLSFMQEGRAGYWRDRYLENLQKDEATYASWPKFLLEFRKDFYPVNEAMEARNKLESTQYHQGKGSVRDYVDGFQLLVHHAGYESDGYSNVMRFRRGLSSEIQNSIAESATGVPKEDDLSAWIAAAERLDLNRQSNQAFRFGVFSKTQTASPSNTSTRTTAPASGFRTFSPMTTTVPRSTTTATNVSHTPATGSSHMKPLPMGIPMDVDAARQRRDTPVVCFQCKRPGHVQAQCPNRFDVRHLTIDELEEELQARAQQRDMEDLQAGTAAPEMVLADAPAVEEDFTQGR